MKSIADLLRMSGIDPREAELLMAFTLKKDRPYVLAHKPDAIDDKSARRFMSLAGRRRQHEPIAYLTGSQPFFGRDFLVDRRTLIPRPETEALADLVIKHLRRRTLRTLEDAKDVIVNEGPSIRRARRGTRDVIVDVGTGSGCLAVTLAIECPAATVIASDISDATLGIARQNARRLGADVTFVKDDLLGPKVTKSLSVIPALRPPYGEKAGTQKNNQRQNRMDPRIRKDNKAVFVANLPYLPMTDKKTMMADVVKFEPSQALFAGPDGTALIVKLMRQIRILNVQCSMFFELDPRQTKKLTALAHQLFPGHKVKIENDLCGRERFLTVTP